MRGAGSHGAPGALCCVVHHLCSRGTVLLGAMRAAGATTTCLLAGTRRAGGETSWGESPSHKMPGSLLAPLQFPGVGSAASAPVPAPALHPAHVLLSVAVLAFSHRRTTCTPPHPFHPTTSRPTPLHPHPVAATTACWGWTPCPTRPARRRSRGPSSAQPCSGTPTGTRCARAARTACVCGSMPGLDVVGELRTTLYTCARCPGGCDSQGWATAPPHRPPSPLAGPRAGAQGAQRDASARRQARQRFAEIRAAYEVLRDPETRRQYDSGIAVRP